MKSIQNIIIALFLTALFACSSDEGAVQNNAPFVMALSPVQAKANDVVRIHGRNFSTNRGNNEVIFNDKPAVVIEASADMLQVVVPPGEGSLAVHVHVLGAEAKGMVPTFTYVQITDYRVGTLAGNSTFGLQDGTGAAASFRNPEGVAISPDGSIIVADRGNHSIRKITPEGVVTTILGDGTSGYVNGDVSTAKLKAPWKLCVDKQGNIFIADRDNHAIRKIDTNGQVTTVAGTGTSGYVDGPGAVAKFNQPIDVAVDENGILYVADNSNHKIRKITPEGEVSTLAGGTAGFSDGALSTSMFRNPSGVAVDGEGNVYVADRLNHRIRKIDLTLGQVTTVAGTGSKGTRDGAVGEAQFSDPYGLDVSNDGRIVVADLNNHKIRMIENDEVSTLAGSTTGFMDGAGVTAKLQSPTDVAIFEEVVYIADLANHRVRKIYKK